MRSLPGRAREMGLPNKTADRTLRRSRASFEEVKSPCATSAGSSGRRFPRTNRPTPTGDHERPKRAFDASRRFTPLIRHREMHAVGLAFGILSNVLGGATYIVTKWALAGFPPATLIVVRTLIALLCFSFTLPRNGLSRATRGDWFRLSIIGTLGLGIPHVLSANGLARTDAVNGALLVGLEPIAIVLLSAMFLDERLRPAQLLGVSFSVLGATLVVSRGEPRFVLSDTASQGALLMVLASILWGVYTVAAKPTLKRVPPRTLSAVSSAISLLAVLPAAILESNQLDTARMTEPRALAAAIGLGVFVSYGGATLWNASLERLTASELAVLIFIQPVAGTAVAWLAGEHVPPRAMIGGALVLLGVYLAERGPRRRSPIDAPANTTG